jgi:hypothetical protein
MELGRSLWVGGKKEKQNKTINNNNIKAKVKSALP